MLGNFFFSSTGAAAYDIEQSLRFRSDNSAYLNRTPSSAGNRKTWTWSAWVKRGKLGAEQCLFLRRVGSNNAFFRIIFGSTDYIQVWDRDLNNSTRLQLNTNAKYRDPNAWYHIVFALDTTEATSSDRGKLYVNGSEVTSFSTSTYPSQNATLGINTNELHTIGVELVNNTYFDGYMAEVHFVDGTALEPTSFGRFDANNVWVPKEYSGSYGTNGFYLDFSNTSAIGEDDSGNDNDWTGNSFELTNTTYTSYDFFLDTPTKNGAVWNALDVQSGSVTEANRRQKFNGSPYSQMTVPIPLTGTTEFVVPTTIGDYGNLQYVWLGFSERNNTPTGGTNLNQTDYDVYIDINASQGTRNYNCVVYENGTQIGTARLQTGTGYNANAQNPTMLCRINRDNNTVYFENIATTSVASGNISIASSAGRELFFTTGVDHRDASVQKNIQLRAAGDYTDQGTVNTSNMPEVDIKDPSKYFNTVLYSGNSSTQSITGVGFQPDLVWIKRRNASYSHQLIDAVRGKIGSDSSYARLASNLNNEEATPAGDDGVQSLDADGFTTLSDESYNETGGTYVAWCWKAGGSGSSNTDGSTTSTVSASPSSGFSIVNFTGTGSALTVGHGLGVAPDMIIAKPRGFSDNWVVWHNSFDMDEYIYLQTTAVKATTSSPTTFWNNTAPTSTVVSVGANSNTNVSGEDTILYCFSEVAGYSKIGSYTGNGSSKRFVYLGFKPAWILIRRTNEAAGWAILDSARNPYNIVNGYINANQSNAEGVGTGTNNYIDFLSNGFRCMDGSAGFNESGDTYIFMAFAEQPFGGENVSPATAR